MKKVKYLLFSILLFGMFGIVANAATISVKANKSTVTVGDTITITATVSGEDADAWSYCLTYSGSVSPNGGLCVEAGSITNGRSSSFSFKATASGTAKFGIGSASVLDYAANDSPISKGSATVTINAKSSGVTSNPSGSSNKNPSKNNSNASTDANLKSLSVEGYDIVPNFDKNVKDYTLEVENNVENIVIHYSTSDDDATVSGAGTKTLTEGINKFNIVVTAEKGNTKTYTLTVNRKELDPINVKIDNKNLTVVRKAEALQAPDMFVSSTVIINDEEIPAFKNDAAKIVLVGLKDENGNINLYIYNEKKDTYELYSQFSSNKLTITPVNTSNKIDGYEIEKKVKIDGVEVKAFCKDKNAKLVLVFGINLFDGSKGWYSYDINEGTLQKYYEDTKENEVVVIDRLPLYILIGAGACLLLASLIIIILSIMCSSVRKKNKKLIAMLESKIANQSQFWQINSKEENNSNKKGKEKEKNSKNEVKKELNQDTINDIAITKTNNILFSDDTNLNDIIDDVTLESSVVRDESNVLTKKELKKMLKEQKKAEKIERQKAKREFLDDVDYKDDSAFDKYVREETEVLPVVETKKKKKKKKKKEVKND